jgi:alpha-tubulin suppressor-like RCC1 family protein
VLVLTPASAALVVGDSLIVTPLLKGGTADERAPGRSLRWQSSNARVVQVSETGVARAVSAGSARIIAFGESGRDSIAIRVVTAQVAVYSVLISPSTAPLEVGSELRLSAETRDAQNRRLSDRVVTWTSSNPEVASVDERTGDVTARQAGVVTISAISESARASIALTVTAPPVVSAPRDSAPPTTEPEIRFERVAAGGSSSCATSPGNLVFCWGAGRTTPRAMSDGFESVAIGRTHQCGLRNGSAFCWGTNDKGQIGDGSNANQTSPVAVSGDIRFAVLGAGESHTCGLDRDGAVHCWGANNAGQLGNGSSRDSRTPVLVRSNLKFISLTVGKAHTCAIASDGQAFCWGDGFAGALGNNLKQNQSQPYPVRGDTRWQRLSAGDDFTCGLSVTGKALCWGDNRRGQLGDTRNSERLSPVDVARIPAFSEITTGRFHACGLADGGRVYCWGSNERGQLGNGTTASVSSPTQIESTLRFISVVAGNLHTCAVTDGNAVYCWGDNSAGQLGDGSGASHSTPVLVRALRNRG